MKLKRLTYSEFHNLASNAGEIVNSEDPNIPELGYITITFELFRRVHNNVYEESVPEVRAPESGNFMLEWDNSSLGPYIQSNLFLSHNIKIKEPSNTTAEFWYTTFSIDGKEEEELRDRYETILNKVEAIISAFPTLALIASVKYFEEEPDCSHPLCVLLEVDNTPTNQEIVKMLI